MARRLEALKKHAIKPGEVRNPSGNNGKSSSMVVQAYLNEPTGPGSDRKRIQELLDACYTSAVDGEAAAQKLLIEQYAGKARIPQAEFALVLASHFHQVAKDQVEIGLKLLGDQLNTMSDEQKRAFWDRCERDPRRFLEAAQAEIEGRERGKLPDVP